MEKLNITLKYFNAVSTVVTTNLEYKAYTIYELYPKVMREIKEEKFLKKLLSLGITKNIILRDINEKISNYEEQKKFKLVFNFFNDDSDYSWEIIQNNK